MEQPFDFGSLPPEVARVLHAVINWRMAKDLGHDATAAKHLCTLNDASIDFREWARHQGELRATSATTIAEASALAIKRDVDIIDKLKGRQERQQRIALEGNHLHIVPKDRS